NALTGEKGREDDHALALAVAKHLSIAPEEVLTASTGVLGHRLPLARIIEGIQPVLSELKRNPITFAESIMTTDWVTKMATREIFVAGQRIRLHAVAKGSGMVSPALATTLCFITTDARIKPAALRLALASAVDATLN